METRQQLTNSKEMFLLRSTLVRKVLASIKDPLYVDISKKAQLNGSETDGELIVKLSIAISTIPLEKVKELLEKSN